MSDVQELRDNYKTIRARLVRPPNSVPDAGIDLKRKTIPMAPLASVRDSAQQEINAEEPATIASNAMTDAQALYELDAEIAALLSKLEALQEERDKKHAVAMSRRPQSRIIMQMVSVHYDKPIIDITSARRTGEVVRPRQVAMYLMRHMTGLSLPAIGRLFGGRDHTTVMHASRKIEELRKVDAAFEAEITALMASITELVSGIRPVAA